MQTKFAWLETIECIYYTDKNQVPKEFQDPLYPQNILYSQQSDTKLKLNQTKQGHVPSRDFPVSYLITAPSSS